MHLIYLVLSQMPASTLVGRYAKLPKIGSPVDGKLWSQLQAAFKVIEIDFIVTGPEDRWMVDQVEVIAEEIASDHRPVIAVLRPPLD